MNKLCWGVSFFLMVSVVALPASRQFGIMAGYSKVTSSNSDLWSGGFYIAGHGLIQVARGLYVGLEGSYHRWGLEGTYQRWKQERIYHRWRLNNIFYRIGAKISGSGSNFQIFPCLRYEIEQAGTFRPFIHAGVGLSVMDARAEASVSSHGRTYSEKVDESADKIGGNIGIGTRILTSNSMGIEAIALFNLFSGKVKTVNWFSIGLGISFGR